jgi:formate dehydrogenase major subunit
MAECHPVGFQWVMAAKARGATIIHVDPRFTRTSALADIHVPLRAGTDIAFLGGLINYVLTNDKWFREYVVAYTNAPMILREDFRDTEDLDGLFSGFDADGRHYDPSSWEYEGADVDSAAGQRDQWALLQRRREEQGAQIVEGETGGSGAKARRPRESSAMETAGAGGGSFRGRPHRDDTLRHPRCVFQVLRRHFARYTPGTVARICGISEQEFLRVAEALTANSGRDRTSAFVYSVGWTHHTVGVQYIRTASILQLLLGNIGRPGGGILALRGHASIQGSTDIPTLFDILPGYLPMPHAHEHLDLLGYIATAADTKGFWGNIDTYTVSLLKAWWGDAATADNDYCFGYLPRLSGGHSNYDTVTRQVEGKSEGYFLVGENPAVGTVNSRLSRIGLANLKWLVVRDLNMIESATFWKNAPELESGQLRTEDIATEVFFLPAAAHVEKDGSFTNTQRMLQWHHTAVEPTGDQRSELWFFYHLGRIIREKLAGSTDERDRPVLDLTWDYPTHGPTTEPSADAVLAEIGGWDADGTPLSSYTQLKTDGSTRCGCWIYCGCYQDGVNQPARRDPQGDRSHHRRMAHHRHRPCPVGSRPRARRACAADPRRDGSRRDGHASRGARDRDRRGGRGRHRTHRIDHRSRGQHDHLGAARRGGFRSRHRLPRRRVHRRCAGRRG